MIKRVLVGLLFTAFTGILQSCFIEPKNATGDIATQDSIQVESIAEPVQSMEEIECVFDTSTYQFTTQALRKHNPTQRFNWNKVRQEATVPFENGDTLILHIGGCNHFSYLAFYRTDSTKFDQEGYLFEKTKWLAETYFDNGFDEKYAHFITNKQYQLEDSKPGVRLYSITDPDTTVTNRVYEGFYFKKTGERTEIRIYGYLN